MNIQATAPPTVGGLLREWRTRRRMSQCDLAADAGISTKHLSFVETGRARPSAAVLLTLAGCLNMPLRDRNAMLSRAGFDPAFGERPLHDPGMTRFRINVEALLAAHEPNPAFAVNQHWLMLAGNPASSYLCSGADPALLRQPVNLMRLMLHPAGLATRIVNLAAWRSVAIARMRRQIDLSGDPVLIDLLDEIRDYPAGSELARDGGHTIPVDVAAVPLLLATIDGVLAFMPATTRFSTAQDITAAELSIETFLPADRATARVLTARGTPALLRDPDDGGFRVAVPAEAG